MRTDGGDGHSGCVAGYVVAFLSPASGCLRDSLRWFRGASARSVCVPRQTAVAGDLRLSRVVAKRTRSGSEPHLVAGVAGEPFSDIGSGADDECSKPMLGVCRRCLHPRNAKRRVWRARPPFSVSARAGVTLQQLQQTLAGFIPRGSCGAAAAAFADSDLCRRVLLGHEACPPPIRRLSPDEYTAKGVAGWRSRHAGDSDAPAVLMRRCAGHDSIRVRGAAASNMACPAAVIEALSDDPVSEVRKRLAAQPALRGHVLERFAADVDEEVRCAAARHPALPATVWAAWAADPDETRRGAAAENPSAPAEALQQLAGDSDSLVRQAVATNPACPLETLSNLRRDRHELVAMSALTNRDLRTARDCTTPAERLAALTLHSSEDVLRAVASNPFCPDDALERLAGNDSSSVRREAARNHNCPQQSLERLAGNFDDAVREAVAANPATGPNIVRRLSTGVVDSVRRAAMRNPTTPPQALRQAVAEDPDRFVALRGRKRSDVATLGSAITNRRDCRAASMA